MNQKWFQSKSLWAVMVMIAIQIFLGIVAMGAVGMPKWVSIVLGGVVAVFLVFQKYLSAQNPNAPLLSDAPANVLMYVAMGLSAIYAYLQTKGIMFPAETFLSIVGTIGIFIGADRMKNATVIANNPAVLNQSVMNMKIDEVLSAAKAAANAAVKKP